MKQTPLYENHIALGAKMGPFAGYEMPLYYKDGALKEHEWVRSNAGMFDVSHMGQVLVDGPGAMEFVHKICPSDFTNAPDGRAKYTVLLNETGGIIDDMIVTRIDEETFFIVINAGRKDVDLEWMRDQLFDGVSLDVLDDRALIALQGKDSEKVLKEVLGFDCSDQPYMWFSTYEYNDGEEIYVSRLGYTGEDGFELSVPKALAPGVWDKLVAHDSVEPAGLAARDTLRLEMGYPLYGHDLDDETTPVEAGLGWVVSKNNDSFFGHGTIREQQEEGTDRIRVGIMLKEKGIAREGAEILDKGEKIIGTLTSGGFSPVLQKGIGQGYIESGSAEIGDNVLVRVRNRELEAEITGLSFVKAGTKSMKKQAA